MTTLKSITTSFEIVKELTNQGRVTDLRQRFNFWAFRWEYVFTHIIKP